MSFLTIDGKLATKNGKLVTTNSPEDCDCCGPAPSPCPPPSCIVDLRPGNPAGGLSGQGHANADLKQALQNITIVCQQVGGGGFYWEGAIVPNGASQPVTAVVGFDFSSSGRSFVYIRGGNNASPDSSSRLNLPIPNATLTPPGTRPATISFFGYGSNDDSTPPMTEQSVCQPGTTFTFPATSDNPVGAVYDGRNILGTQDFFFFDQDFGDPLATITVTFLPRRRNPLP